MSNQQTTETASADTASTTPAPEMTHADRTIAAFEEMLKEPVESTEAEKGEPANETVPTSTEKTEATETPTSKFDDKMKAYAKEYGYEESDLEAFDNPEQLRRSILAQERREAARAEAAKPKDEKPADKPVKPERIIPNDFEPTPRFKIEKPDAWEPETLSVLNGIAEHHGKIADELRQDFGAAITEMRSELSRELGRQAGLSRIREMDHFIEKLGDDWAEQFGKGASLKMDRRTKEWQTRNQLFIDADNAYQQAVAAGQDPDFADILERSKWKLYGDKIKAVAAKEIKKEIAERVEMRSTPPGGNATPLKETSPLDAFKQEVAKVREKHASGKA